jgi:hypothetical protein
LGAFVQGDKGRELLFSCGFTSLNENDLVKITIKYEDKIFTKDAELIYPKNGRCKVPLTSSEIQNVGIYKYQSTVYFSDGKILTNPSIGSFRVSEKLDGIPTIPSDEDTIVIIDGGEF